MKIHPYNFLVILFTDRQTDKQTKRGSKHCLPPSVAEIIVVTQ